MLLDNQTLLFSLMLISSMMSLSLLIVTSRNESDGIRRWAVALALEAMVWLLTASQAHLPFMPTIVVANILMASAQSLKLAAIHAYRKIPVPVGQCVAPILVMAALPILLPFDDLRYRIPANSTIFAIQFMLMLRVLWQDQESRSGKAWRMLTGTLSIIVVLLVVRAMVGIMGKMTFATATSSITPNPVQLAVFIGLIALNQLGAMGFILMIKERIDREVRTLAMTDPLTRVLNRRAFMEQAERHMAQALRHKLPLAVLMIDIDHFKRINDAHGHLTGDRVLTEVTALLTAQLRKQDLLGRYGGEEFCVLLPSTDQLGAAALAEKLRLAVESSTLHANSHLLTVTISIGVTACDGSCPNCEPDFTALLEDADRALYLAKKNGRNRVVPLSLSCLGSQVHFV